MSLTQIFTGVLYQNYLEGYKFQTQGCNLQVITLRNDVITIALSLYMVRLSCQTLTVTVKVWHHIYLVSYFYSVLLHVPTVYFSGHEVKILVHQRSTINRVRPTRYRTRHFFNNFTTNDTATKFEAYYRHIPLHFSHNERTPVQISLQCLHWC